MAPAKRKTGTKRPPRATLLRRWLAVGVLALVGYLYWHPLETYLERRGDAAARAAEVRALAREKAARERRLAAQTSDRALVREARRLGYVLPGERLFIVKGIAEWREARAARARAASTIGGDG